MSIRDERAALREKLAATLREQYEAGASIRVLADEHVLTYGTTRNLLIEAGAQLRSRGGPNRGRAGNVIDEMISSIEQQADAQSMPGPVGPVN